MFRVNRAVHLENRGFLRQQIEHGGNLAFDFRHHQLVRGDLGTGRYNRIEMQRGVVDWHSHPQRCLNNNTCALGLPSPMDLGNIILGSVYGTSAHLVYAREGTYLVQLQAPVLLQIRRDRRALGDYIAFITDRFERLHRHFIRSHMRYKQYRLLWVREANASGLHAHLFCGNRVPRITVVYDCHLPAAPAAGCATCRHRHQASAATRARVHVPQDVEYRMLGTLTSGRGKPRTMPGFL